jgi:hypothetical protein
MSDLLAVGSLVGQARTGKALLRNRTVLEILRRLKVFQPPACPFSPEIQILFRRSKKPPVFASLKQKTVRPKIEEELSETCSYYASSQQKTSHFCFIEAKNGSTKNTRRVATDLFIVCLSQQKASHFCIIEAKHGSFRNEK